MTKKLRIGIVGCGRIALVSHIPELAALPGVQIAALCDVEKAKTVAAREKGAPDAVCYADFATMLKETALDAVSICTPNRLHAPMTLEAFRHGLHVLCEKPMAGTLPEATRMIQAAHKAGRVLHINQSLRYSALYRTITDMVHQGKIGDPLHIRCIRAMGTTPDKHWSPGASWFVSKADQGGLILDIGIHMTDLMTWIAGEVASVGALTDTRTPGIDVTDHVGALFRFNNGATGVLELSWSLPVGAALLEIYGSRGRLLAGFDAEHPIEWSRPRGSGTTVSHPRLKRGVKSSFYSFLAAVRGRLPSPTPGELGRDALAICSAIDASAGQGRFVKVKRF